MDNAVKNSHDIVAHWMVQMNMFTGSYMSNNKMGIFRSAAYINSNLRVDANGDLICPEFVDQGMLELRKNADNDYKGIRYKSKPITEGFLNRAIFPISKPLNQVTFTFGGMFSVKRDRILNYPKIVYQGLIEELTSKNPQGGVNGYILEKLWLYIFED
jgi:hypothetical protein